MSPDELIRVLDLCLSKARENGLQIAGIDICGEAEPHDAEGCTKSSTVNRALLEYLTNCWPAADSEADCR